MLSPFKYCVIIPYRNLPDLLRKCLYSIPKQPFIYVLVIDNSDESKDASLIVSGESWCFGGLSVIELEPHNIGYIRNEALRFLRENNFNGKLVFADSDDYFTEEADYCFRKFKDSEYDLVWFNVLGSDEHGKESGNADYINHLFVDYEETGSDDAFRYNYGPVWGKFIDMGLIERHNLSFQELESCEDTFFSAQLGYYAVKPHVCHVPPIYVYVQREDSLVMTMNPRKARMGFVAAYTTTRWLKDRTKSGFNWTQYNVIWHWINWCQRDFKAWGAFPKVILLCNKKNSLQGALKAIKRRIKSKTCITQFNA